MGETRDLAVTGETVTTAMRLQELAEPGETLLDEASVRAARSRLDVEVVGRAPGARPLDARPGQPAARRAAPSPGRGRRPGTPHRPWRRPGPPQRRARRDEAERSRADRGRHRRRGIGKTRLVADLEEEARGLGFAWTWVENLSYTTGESYGWARTFAQRVADEAAIDSGSYARRLLFSDDLDEANARRYAGGIALMAREAAFTGWEAEAPLVPTDPAPDPARSRRGGRALHAPAGGARGPAHPRDRRPALDGCLERAPRRPAAAHRRRPADDRLRHDAAGAPCRPGPDSTTSRRSPSTGSTRPARSDWLPRSPARELDDDTIARLHDRTAGNPLFVGETVRALLEDDALVTPRRTAPPPRRRGRAGGPGQPAGAARGTDRRPAGRLALDPPGRVGDRHDLRADAGRPADGPELGRRPLGRPRGRRRRRSRRTAPPNGGSATRSSATWPMPRPSGRAGGSCTRASPITSSGVTRPRRSVSWPSTGRRRGTASAPSRSWTRPPRLPSRSGATVEALGYWRMALELLGDDPGAVPIRARVALLESPGSPRGATSPVAATTSRRSPG